MSFPSLQFSQSSQHSFSLSIRHTHTLLPSGFLPVWFFAHRIQFVSFIEHDCFFPSRFSLELFPSLVPFLFFFLSFLPRFHTTRREALPNRFCSSFPLLPLFRSLSLTISLCLTFLFRFGLLLLCRFGLPRQRCLYIPTHFTIRALCTHHYGELGVSDFPDV